MKDTTHQTSGEQKQQGSHIRHNNSELQNKKTSKLQLHNILTNNNAPSSVTGRLKKISS